MAQFSSIPIPGPSIKFVMARKFLCTLNLQKWKENARKFFSRLISSGTKSGMCLVEAIFEWFLLTVPKSPVWEIGRLGGAEHPDETDWNIAIIAGDSNHTKFKRGTYGTFGEFQECVV